MNKKGLRIGIIVGLTIVVVAIIAIVILKTQPSNAKIVDLTATLSEILGDVQVKDQPQSQFNPVSNGFILNAIMQLQTQEQSRVRLDLSTGSIIRLGQKTLFSLESPTGSSGSVLYKIELQIGRVWIALKGGSLDVNTPRGIASVRGSYMSVWVKSSSNEIIVCCLEGSCTYQNDGGIVNLTTGQKIISSDTSVKPGIQPMDQSDIQDWKDNSPESAPVIPQVATLVVTSTPTFTTSVSATSTVIPEATPVFTTTPGILAMPYPTEYAGFDPAMIEKCLSYGYTSEKTITCLIELSMTITPWLGTP